MPSPPFFMTVLRGVIFGDKRSVFEDLGRVRNDRRKRLRNLPFHRLKLQKLLWRKERADMEMKPV